MKNLFYQIIAVASFICIVASFGGFEQDMFGLVGLMARVIAFGILMVKSAEVVVNG